MDKKKSSVVDRAVIKGAAEMVARCKGKCGKRYAGLVRRQNILHQAALAVESLNCLSAVEAIGSCNINGQKRLEI